MATATPLHFDPVLAAIDRAPPPEVPLTDEQRAQLDRQVEHIRTGRSTPIPHEVVQARFDARLAQLEAITERLRARGLDTEILWSGTPDEIQAYCDDVFGLGDDAVVILCSKRDEAFAAERRAYETATGEHLELG